MDEDALWRAVASVCGAMTVLAEVLDPKNTQDPKDAKKPRGPVDAMGKGLAYADVWLDHIDPFAMKDDGVRLTLESKAP